MSTRQYIGARYVPKFYSYNGSPAWRSGVEYEALTIVTSNYNSYTSKKPVPSSVGRPEDNPEYWVATGMYNQQVEQYRQEVVQLEDRVDDAEDAIGALNGRLNTDEGTIASQGARLTNVEGDINTIEGNINTIEGNINSIGSDITAIQGRLTTDEGNISSLGTRLTTAEGKITNLMAESARIFVVGANCQYTTIASAITAAKTFINSNGGRVVIWVMPGTYNENIVLHPNPGIDFIGYGAKLEGSFDYPNCVAYFSGRTTMVGMTLTNTYSGSNNTYALHVERDGNYTRGVLEFIDCTFVSINGAGAGCGMEAGGELVFRNCRFYTASGASDKPALYLHNALGTNNDLQTVYLVNCYFESPDLVIRFDDAANMNGSTTSPIVIRCFNNNSNRNKVRFFNNDGTYANAASDVLGPNYTILGGGGNIYALDRNLPREQDMYLAPKGAYCMIPLLYKKDWNHPYVTYPGSTASDYETVTVDAPAAIGVHKLQGIMSEPLYVKVHYYPM